MDLSEIIIEACGTLTVNRLRTALATLGIIIGIGSVIALISLGQASQQAVQNQIQSLGSNLLTIQPNFSQQGIIRSATNVTSLTYDDARAIASSPQITSVQSVSPELQNRSQITAGRNNTNTQVIGATPAYTTVHKVTMSQGNFFSEADLNSQARVAVLGPQTVNDLFSSGENPIGQTIRISGHSIKVIGVTATKGGSGFLNQDDRIYVPLTTAQKILFGEISVSSIAVEAKNADLMTTAQDQMGYLLLSRHKLSNPTKADFQILSQSDVLDTASSITGIFTALLSGIAAISLVVGGIGIMNIMLVTVTERTREIGLAIGVSAAIGILFGWYPAKKAADLQPIEALRYE